MTTTHKHTAAVKVTCPKTGKVRKFTPATHVKACKLSGLYAPAVKAYGKVYSVTYFGGKPYVSTDSWSADTDSGVKHVLRGGSSKPFDACDAATRDFVSDLL